MGKKECRLTAGLDNPVGFDRRGYHSHGENLDPKLSRLSENLHPGGRISAFEISRTTIDFVSP